jgi:hypothetical protein
VLLLLLLLVLLLLVLLSLGPQGAVHLPGGGQGQCIL